MNNDTCLIKIIANMAIFLEFTDEESLEPDIAVEMMESISAELQRLNSDDKKKVVDVFNEISEEYKGEQVAYIKQLPEMLGLI